MSWVVLGPESFLGTRVRLQRLHDGRFFAGWLIEFHRDVLFVRKHGASALDEGDECFVQAFGQGTSMLFRATVLGSQGAKLSLRVLDKIQFATSFEEMRLLVEGPKCSVKLGWYESQCDVLDISHDGLGIASHVDFESGEHALLKIQCSAGTISGSGVVRYCRRGEAPGGSYRVGIELSKLDPTNSQKWDQLFRKAIATPRVA